MGKEVIITEKIDGGCTCLYRGEVYARSTGQPSHAGWMAMVRKHHAHRTIPYDSIAFYGEDIYGVHSIEYDPVDEAETFRLFATRHICRLPVVGEDLIQDWDTTVWLGEQIGVLPVPVLFKGVFHRVEDITAWFQDNLSLPSALGGNREGFVMRVTDSFPASKFGQNVAKFVRPNHVQTDQHWSRNWQPCKLKPY